MSIVYRGSFYPQKEEAVTTNNVEKKSRKTVTDLTQLDSDEIIFLVELVDNGYKEFIFNPESNELKDNSFEYVLDKLTTDQVIAVIKSLDEKNYLEKTSLAPDILCPSCFSPKAKIIFSCPKCSSIHLSKYEVIEHTYCGYADEKKVFIVDGMQVCPKCKTDLIRVETEIEKTTPEHNSEIYRIKSALFKCNECKKEVNIPNISFQCIECGNSYSHIDANYQVPIKYLIPESTFNKIRARNKVNLLIVEDFAPQADVVAMLLSNTGKHIEYNIAIAGNGTSAILALEENDFDVILLDLGLPDINGLDLLKKIKTRWPNIQVIVLTGYDDIEIAVEAMKNGASEYLIKKDDTIQNLPDMMKKVVRKITNDSS